MSAICGLSCVRYLPLYSYNHCLIDQVMSRPANACLMWTVACQTLATIQLHSLQARNGQNLQPFQFNLSKFQVHSFIKSMKTCFNVSFIHFTFSSGLSVYAKRHLLTSLNMHNRISLKTESYIKLVWRQCLILRSLQIIKSSQTMTPVAWQLILRNWFKHKSIKNSTVLCTVCTGN